MVNNTGRIVLLNGHAEALFRYSREQLMGKPIEILLPERFRHAHVGHRTRCRERMYDAIAFDIMLPDMSGRAVLEKLRGRGLNQHTPITVMTLIARKGAVAGFQVNDLLSKPISQEELVSALERCGVASSISNHPKRRTGRGTDARTSKHTEHSERVRARNICALSSSERDQFGGVLWNATRF
jgi:PAS domain S-box-containing protein